MAEFDDFDLEVQDEKDSDSEHQNGSVTTAGSPETITAAASATIQHALVINHRTGPNANALGVYLLVNTDGGSDFTTVPRNGSVKVKGPFSSFRIDASVDGAKYEVILHKSSS